MHDDMLAEKNPYIQSAYKQLQIISQDKKKCLEYEAREKAIRDYNQLMYEAEKRGKEIGEYEKAINIAKNMFAFGVAPELISKITNLSEQDWISEPI